MNNVPILPYKPLLPGIALGAAVWLFAAWVFGGTVTVEWEPPADPDLAGVRVFYAPAVVFHSVSNGIVTWRPVGVIGPTNQVWATAGTNRAPITATTGFYAFWATAVATYGAESDPCEIMYAPVGKPQTIKIRRVTTP